MAAYTKVQIIANAIALLGKGPIATISSGGDFASFAENMYDLTISSVLAKGNWRFATAIVALSQLVAEPPVDDWQYAYQLPATYLALVRLYPDSRQFQIYENKLMYANFNSASIEYRFLPDASRFPPHFVEFFTYYLASVIALTGGLTGDIVTRLENKADKALGSALATEGASNPNYAIRGVPYIHVRGAIGGK
jgi:hypothetical protein